MWNIILKSLVMPLVQQGLAMLIKWFKNSSEDSKRDNAIDDAVERLKKSTSEQERKDALKDLVRGIGALNP